MYGANEDMLACIYFLFRRAVCIYAGMGIEQARLVETGGLDSTDTFRIGTYSHQNLIAEMIAISLAFAMSVGIHGGKCDISSLSN